MQGSSSKSPIGVPQQLISRGVCAAALALTLIGTGIFAVATRLGIGIYTDSIVYIGAARSILAGDGFQFLTDIGQFSPITQYPPGYPWLVAALSWTGLDPIDSARWISVFFSAGNSLLVAYIVLRSTASFGAMLLAVFLSFAAFPMVYINSQALSEPPFIFLTLLGYCFLARYLRESHAASVYWFALAIGLSCLVRYVGVAFGMTGAAVILFHDRDDWRKRFVDATTFSVLSAFPSLFGLSGTTCRRATRSIEPSVFICRRWRIYCLRWTPSVIGYCRRALLTMHRGLRACLSCSCSCFSAAWRERWICLGRGIPA